MAEKQSSVSVPPPTRVMLAVNESTIKGYPYASISSKGAFEWTLQKIVRSNTSGFKLLVLHVVVPGSDGCPGCDVDIKDLRGHDLLEYFLKRCREIGVECEAWTKRGDPKEVICHEVKRVKPDLLVVGSRGLGPFQRVFLGTVSDFCAKHAECPVVTIKRSAEETPKDPADD